MSQQLGIRKARHSVPIQVPLWCFLAAMTGFAVLLGYVFQQPFASYAIKHLQWQHIVDVNLYSREYATSPGWIGIAGDAFLVYAAWSAWNRASRSTILGSILMAGMLLAFDAVRSMLLSLSTNSSMTPWGAMDNWRYAIYSTFRWNGDIPFILSIAILVVSWFRGLQTGSVYDRTTIACGLIVLANLILLAGFLILFIEVFHCGLA